MIILGFSISCNSHRPVNKDEKKVTPIGQNYDSLKTHSRFVVLFKNRKQVTNGTGFFLRFGGKVFFVSNYHTATGFNPFQNIQIAECDQIAVCINPDSTYQFATFEIKRNKVLEDKIKRLDYPDLFVIEVDTKTHNFPERWKEIDVSTLIDSSYYDIVPNRVLVFGFPEDKNPKLTIGNGEWVITSYRSDYDTLKSIFTPNEALGIVDFNTYIFRYKGLNFMIDRGTTREGMSGSPVFGEFEAGTAKTYKLLGVLFGGNTILNIGEVVRIKKVLEIIDLMSKQN